MLACGTSWPVNPPVVWTRRSTPTLARGGLPCEAQAAKPGMALPFLHTEVRERGRLRQGWQSGRCSTGMFALDNV